MAHKKFIFKVSFFFVIKDNIKSINQNIKTSPKCQFLHPLPRLRPGSKIPDKLPVCQCRQQYDLNAIGVFQLACDEKSERLVGHIPVEISQLINYFISAANTNTIIAVVTGKRKREIGLVVPAKYFAYTNNKKNAEMLMKKLLEKKNILELAVHNENIVKRPRIF